VPLPQPPPRAAGAAFDLWSAKAANVVAPISIDPARTAYYLVRLIGPPKSEWLAHVRDSGGVIQASLPGYTLLVGLLPTRVQELGRRPWVEDVTPYRAAMKLSPTLLPHPRQRSMEPADLIGANVPCDGATAPACVEISIFPGESTTAVAARVRELGGQVLVETAQTVAATVSRQAIGALAEEQAVQAIQPHTIPRLHNAQSARFMGVRQDRTPGDLTLTGAGQIVAIADSGPDASDLGTMHPDVRERVVRLVSHPVGDQYLPFAADPRPIDHGPADVHDGRGTRVAGSDPGNAGVAQSLFPLDATVQPFPYLRVIAPEARLFFQSIEQRVTWKDEASIRAEGRTPFLAAWPPPAVGLYGTPEDLGALFAPAYEAGARIHANSWGTPDDSTLGAYDFQASCVDVFLWHHRDMLILFSAGNSGEDRSGGKGGYRDGIVGSDSVGPPGTAKNCLTVGASDGYQPDSRKPCARVKNEDSSLRFPKVGPAGNVADNADPIDGVAASSSRGPTVDGRIKPDVVAPGTRTLSAQSQAYNTREQPVPLDGHRLEGDRMPGQYCGSSGTSMATPLVAGAAALIRQFLVQERQHLLGGSKPSGALLKALIVNGATPLPGQFEGEVPKGPSPVAGFGLVNVKRSLGLSGAPRIFFSDEPDLAVETGELRAFALEAVDLGQPLNITLAWTDAPSLPHLGGLQNQLYLQVVDPAGAMLDGDTTRYPLATNNVQQVTIPVPVAGVYEVRVWGHSITQQLPGRSPDETLRQDFALAASNVREATCMSDPDVAAEPLA
jgi:subtilisin family serine protease